MASQPPRSSEDSGKDDSKKSDNAFWSLSDSAEAQVNDKISSQWLMSGNNQDTLRTANRSKPPPASAATQTNQDESISATKEELSPLVSLFQPPATHTSRESGHAMPPSMMTLSPDTPIQTEPSDSNTFQSPNSLPPSWAGVAESSLIPQKTKASHIAGESTEEVVGTSPGNPLAQQSLWSRPMSDQPTSNPQIVRLPRGHLLPPKPKTGFPERPSQLRERSKSLSAAPNDSRKDVFGHRNSLLSNLGTESTPQEELMKKIAKRTIPSKAGNPDSVPSHRRQLTIEDVLGAGKYEVEAETSILKALEDFQQVEQQKNHQRQRPRALSYHHRGISEISTIFTGVPENLAHDFSLEEEDDEDAESDHGQGKPSDGIEASPILNHTETNHDIENPQLSPAAMSHSHSDQSTQTKPLLPKLTPTRRKPRHHRTLTLEDQLTGLTVAMLRMEDIDDVNGRETQGDANGDGNAMELTTNQWGQDAALITRQEEWKPSNRKRLNSTASSLPPIQQSEEPGTITSNNDTGASVESQVSQPQDKPVSPPPTDAYVAKQTQNQNTTLPSRFASPADKLKDDLDVWRNFFRPKSESALTYLRRLLLYLIVPFVGAAAVLYYGFDNPPTGVSEDKLYGDQASASWWLLFVVRQSITLSLALALQAIIIDFLCVGTKFMLRLLGPLLTLLIVQSKGWPFVIFCWSILDFGLLFGDRELAHHWGFFQNEVGLFNRENPSGAMVSTDWNRRVLLIGVSVSIFVALKRFIVGLILGRQTFHHYGEQLAGVMKKMVVIGEVSQLGKQLHRRRLNAAWKPQDDIEALKEMEGLQGLSFANEDETNEEDIGSAASTLNSFLLVDPSKRDPLTDNLLPSERAKLLKLVDPWEEPARKASNVSHRISIASVLKFRKALTFIKNDYPFSFAFGLADTRESCLDSSQILYNRLLLDNRGTDGRLRVETIARTALSADGTLDQEKAKFLVRIFRPDREGCMDILSFVKSVDSVYKEFRLLQASIQNSTQIDRAFENLVDIAFYTVVVTIILSQLGFDPLSLFLSLSSVILAFAFMIGPASSKYFEGLLFILVRRPYGIGDIIHISSVEEDTNVGGSIGWIVQHVTLYETTLTWLATMETSSVSNGSLASSRIINWARSPHARCVIFFHIPIQTKYETLELFKGAIEEYLKIRPREWLAFNAFRIGDQFADKGYMKVEVVVQHHDSWQSFNQIKESRGNLISFCQEVQRMLGMEYHAPPLPIELNESVLHELLPNHQGRIEENVAPLEIESGQDTNWFRHVAQSKHRISLNKK